MVHKVDIVKVHDEPYHQIFVDGEVEFPFLKGLAEIEIFDYRWHKDLQERGINLKKIKFSYWDAVDAVDAAGEHDFDGNDLDTYKAFQDAMVKWKATPEWENLTIDEISDKSF